MTTSRRSRRSPGAPSRRELLHDAALAAGCLGLAVPRALAAMTGGAAGGGAADGRRAGPGAAAGPGPGPRGSLPARDPDAPPEGAGAPPDARGARDRLVVSTWGFGRAANGPAWELLVRGGRHPLDAVEAGVKVIEADPSVTSVGYGGLPNADGVVELDASVMRGDTQECGAVAALRNVLHPVSVARRVMEATPHVLLAGDGALAFARAQGFPEQDLLTPGSRAAWEQWKAGQRARVEPWQQEPDAAAGKGGNHDTIGMIALDGGRLATAVTTSGMAFKLPGRVGDSPIVGAGSWCDDELGAAVSTGVGEEVIRSAGCVSIVEGMRRGLTGRRAGIEVLCRILRRQRKAGRGNAVAFLVVSRSGEVWGGSIGGGFQYAYTDADGTRIVSGEAVT